MGGHDRQAWLPAVRRTAARHVACKSPARAFDSCKRVSAALCRALTAAGFAPELMRLSEAARFWPAADPRWRAIDPFHWVHYLVRLGDVGIDLTRRQFDPAADPVTVEPWSEIERAWTSREPVPRSSWAAPPRPFGRIAPIDDLPAEVRFDLAS